MGFSRQKARALIDLACAIAEGRLDLEAMATEPDEIVVDRLCRLRGVGRWTAEYVLLRGLGRLHVFPGDDVARGTTCSDGSRHRPPSITRASLRHSRPGELTPG